jgi:hypothetical protein
MKRYGEIPPEELADMTEEQINTLVELEMAHEGVAIVSMPAIMPDVEVWKVGELLFADKKEAEQVCKMNILHETTDYDVGYEYKLLDKKPPTLEPVMYYSKALIKNNKDYFDHLKNHHQLYSDWLKYRLAVERVTNEVWSEVRKAQAFKCELEQARKTWKRYLALADNDTASAEAMFKKAYANNREIAKKAMDFRADIKEIVEAQKAEAQKNESVS